MDKKQLQKLEDEHNRKLRNLERLEMDLDDDFHKFSRETDNLLEALSYACRDSSFAVTKALTAWRSCSFILSLKPLSSCSLVIKVSSSVKTNIFFPPCLFYIRQ